MDKALVGLDLPWLHQKSTPALSAPAANTSQRSIASPLYPQTDLFSTTTPPSQPHALAFKLIFNKLASSAANPSLNKSEGNMVSYSKELREMGHFSKNKSKQSF
jgi:hypothetical protein